MRAASATLRSLPLRSVALPAGGEARIAVEIDGDEVASVGRTLFVPDAWSRDQRKRNEYRVIPRGLLALLVTAFAICALVSLVRRLARGEASKRAGAVGAALIAAGFVAGILLAWDAATFDFTVAEPFSNQRLRVVLSGLGIAVAGALIGALVAAVGVRIASGADDGLAPSASRRERWLPAVAIALLMAGAGGFATLFGPATSPRVPAVDAASLASPWVAGFFGGLDVTSGIAAALIGAAVLAVRRRSMEALVAIGFVAAAALGRAASLDSSVAAVVAAAFAGAIGWWIYRTQWRDRPGVVAPTVFCAGLVGTLPNLVHPPYPGARGAALATIVAMGVGYAIWRWLVLRDETAIARTADPSDAPTQAVQAAP